MKFSLTILCCLTLASAFADRIGNVEFNLPSSVAHEWTIANEMQVENGTTRIYIPQGIPSRKVKEFFAVNANRFHAELHDVSILRDTLTKAYSHMDVDFQVLETTSNSVLCEWSVHDNGEEKIHSWCRAFALPKGTVILAYETENTSEIAQARALWLPILKAAKVIN